MSVHDEQMVHDLALEIWYDLRKISIGERSAYKILLWDKLLVAGKLDDSQQSAFEAARTALKFFRGELPLKPPVDSSFLSTAKVALKKLLGCFPT